MHSTHDGMFVDLPRWKVIVASVVFAPIALLAFIVFTVADVIDKVRGTRERR